MNKNELQNWIELILKIIGIGIGAFIFFHAFRIAILFILFLLNG
jgi:uncharacterized membrane protein HdeD (DUF308 family)